MVGAADGGQGTGTGDDRSPVATQRPPWNGEHLRQMPAAPQHGGPPDRSCAGHKGHRPGDRTQRTSPPTRAESLALPQPQGRGPFWGSSAHSCLRSAEPAPPLTQLLPWPRLLPRRWRERQQDTGLRASGRGGHGHVAPAAARPSPARAHAGGGRGSARTASLPRCQPRPVQRKLITQVKF